MLPTSIEILHAFENHVHPVCHSKIENHIHEQDLDCDFHFFNVNPVYLIINNYTSIVPFQEEVIIDKPYSFLFDYQPLSYQLRGPPALY